MRWRGSGARKARRFMVGGIVAGGLALGLFWWGLSQPDEVEGIYTRVVYPVVIGVLARVSGLVPFSVAELLTGAAALFVLGRLAYRLTRLRRRTTVPAAPREAAVSTGLRRAVQLLLFAAAGAGALYAAFVLVWGLNYARPRLDGRLGLTDREIRESELVQLATRVAAETTRRHRLAGLPTDAVSENPLTYAEMSTAIDEAYAALDLPGDPGPERASPVKPAVFSGLMSRLGISGIFVPFTGEPTVNTGPPDVAIAFTAAHEKAHQRAITHEGEASFAAWLALTRYRREPYLNYAASFYASRHLLAAVRHANSADRERAWAALGPGPRRDLDALNAFWAQYRGMVRGAARRVNDSYLRTMRIPDGARSYGTVVRMLIAELRRRPPPRPPPPPPNPFQIQSRSLIKIGLK